MATPTYLDSYQHGVVSTAGAGLYSSVTGDPTISSSAGRLSTYGLRAQWVAQSGQEKYVTEPGDAGSTVRVMSYYARLTSRTAGGVIRPAQIISSDGSTNHFHGPLFDPSTGRITLWSGPSGVQAGPVYSLNTWYLFDWIITFTGSTLVRVDWAIDEVPQTRLDYAPGGSSRSVLLTQWGGAADASSAITAVIDVADAVASVTSADYPIGPHEVKGYSPDSVGTHNLDAATSQFFFKDDGSETALTTSETTSYQVIDGVPLDADSEHVLLRPVVVTGSTTYLDPDGNGTATAWTNTYTNVDDGVRQPTAPSDGLTISGTTTDETAETLTFETDTWTSDTVYTLWVYGTGGNKRGIDVAYSVNGSDPGLAHGTRAQLIGSNGAAGWYSRTLTIASQTELDNLRVEFIANSTAGGGGASAPTINAVYVQATVPDTTTQPTNTWYTEHGFAPSGESSDPVAVRAIVALRNDSGTTANSITAKLRANSNETNIFSGDIGSASTIYKSLVSAAAPGGAAWTDAIFDAATLRWGYSSDADSVPRLEAAMLEALFITAGGAQNVNVSALASAGALGAVSIAVGGVSVTPAALASAAAAGVVIPMNSFPVAGLASASAFGTPTATPGGVSRIMAGLASAGAFGTPQAVPGPVAVVLVALDSAASFGDPSADSTTRVAVVGLDSAGTFGTPVVLPGAVTREMLALATAGAFGSVTAIGGPTTIPVTGLGSAGALGSPTADVEDGNQDVSLSALGSAGAFGAPSILAGGTIIAVVALDSAGAFGALETDGGIGPTFLPAIHGGTHRRPR
jgi:hypothetical protein